MQKTIVIDTNIWIKAMIDSEYNITCDDALSSFFLYIECILALDYKSEIEREYRDNIKNNRRFELRMKQLEREQRKCWVDSRLNKAQEAELYNLGFHEKEDHVFTGTAMNADKILMTEDSDYGVHGETVAQKVFVYMRDQMGLSVVTSKGFLEIFNVQLPF